MRYYDVMLKVAVDYTEAGYIVLMPFVTVIPPEQQGGSMLKTMLDMMHFAKIDMSALVVVVGGYIGESTQNEMNYAEDHGVQITRVYTHLLEGYRSGDLEKVEKGIDYA